MKSSYVHGYKGRENERLQDQAGSTTRERESVEQAQGQDYTANAEQQTRVQAIVAATE